MTFIELLNLSTRYLKEHGIENPRLEAELLVAHALGTRREGLYVRLNAEAEESYIEVLNALLRRRGSGEPLQYILGRQEFWSVELKVKPGLFIPRPETEYLVKECLSILEMEYFGRTPLVLDLGTGSGAVGIALAKETVDIVVIASDISFEALGVARENAIRAGVEEKIAFVNGDLFLPFRKSPYGCFDIVVSNPPYIAREEVSGLAREVKYEPLIAIDGGQDGLDFYRKIISEAHLYIRPKGWLVLEMGQSQSEGIRALMEYAGCYLKPEVTRDLSGVERVIKAQTKQGSI